jgi:Type III restriction enzyme, res subunit
VSEPVINVAALEPLFAPHEEPNQHRARAQGDQPAQVKKGRRPSKIVVAQMLRSNVKQWRETDYPGASDTTRELLHHWFGRDHLIEASGQQIPFRYYFCQCEAIETLIYLYEVRGIRSLTPLVGEFGGPSAETAALGVNPDDDRWAKYAFKLATGAGKTKVMSLAIVWSYFHSLRESNSPMAKHFVVVAPNLTVFERLKTDFKPAEGGKDIFDNDPLIPIAWRGDWNMSVVLQDEASGAATGGTLYLTNIHRLYDSERRKVEAETYDWMGPMVSRAKALDTGAELRKRITGHERVMVLNDEAHHLWDPDSAANKAISYLHETIASRTGAGLVVRADETEEFISKVDFAALPSAHQKMVQQSISLFQFLEKKTGQSFAPVFTPLLGPLDEASRVVMLKLLGADIPTEREAQRTFFEPDLNHLSPKDAEMYRRRGKDLKRTLVDHNGMSPIGLLRWCLQYSRKPNVAAGAVFAAVNRQFSDVPSEIYRLVSNINTFRNDYVAHQEKQLTDPALARKALGEWALGLRRIWELHH